MPSTLFTPTLHTALWAATDGYAAAEAAAAGRGAAASADPWLQRAASAPRDSARAGSGVTLNEVARSLTSQDASSLLDQQFDVSNKTSASSLGSFEASQTNPIFMVPMVSDTHTHTHAHTHRHDDSDTCMWSETHGREVSSVILCVCACLRVCVCVCVCVYVRVGVASCQ